MKYPASQKNTASAAMRRGTVQIGLALACLLVSPACRADCFDDAAAFHHVNPLILRAIALVESRGNSNAINKNSNGSYDLGMMQINSIHLPELARYGLDRKDLLDACKNVYTGAWILRQNMDRYGNTWNAIGAYNASTPEYRRRYAARVQEMVTRLILAGRDAG